MQVKGYSQNFVVCICIVVVGMRVVLKVGTVFILAVFKKKLKLPRLLFPGEMSICLLLLYGEEVFPLLY